MHKGTGWLVALFAASCGAAMAGQAVPLGNDDVNVWLIDQSGPSPWIARLAGTVRYDRYEGHATLGFSCVENAGGAVSMELAFQPSLLGFDTDPYEGPDATASATLTFSSGSSSPVRVQTSGFYGDGGRFDTGTPFVFAARVPGEAMRRWSASPGEPLLIVFPAARSRFAAEFRWPADSARLLRVIGPCLDKAPSAEGA